MQPCGECSNFYLFVIDFNIRLCYLYRAYDFGKEVSVLLDTFLMTLSPMIIVFFCMLIGFVLRKYKVLPENTSTVLSRMELYVFLPAQVLYTFICNCTVAALAAQSHVLLYSCIAMALSFLIGVPLSKVFSKIKNERKIYRFALLFANYGTLGNAIIPQIMGEAALFSYLLFTLPMNVVVYAWAMNSLIPEDGEKKNAWKNFLNPVFISLLLGVALGLLNAGKWMPPVSITTLQSLAACMGPAGMLSTGFVIGGYRMPALLKNVRIYILTLLRLIVLPAVLIGVMWLLGMDRLTLVMTFFAYGSASALTTIVVPAAYGGDTTIGASMAIISHVLCILTIPVMYALLLHIL